MLGVSVLNDLLGETDRAYGALRRGREADGRSRLLQASRLEANALVGT